MGNNPGGWARPVPSPVGTPFGARGPMWSSGRHTGLDFLAPAGTPVQACAAGRVIWAGNTFGAYGIQVKVSHGRGLETWYCHLSGLRTRMGRYVRAGDLVGVSGATGNVTGPHLHLEVRLNGVAVDPAPYLGLGPGSTAGKVQGPQIVGGAPSPTFPGDAGASSSYGDTVDAAATSPAGWFGIMPTPDDVRGVLLLGLFVSAGVALVALGAAKTVQPAVSATVDKAKKAAETAAMLA